MRPAIGSGARVAEGDQLPPLDDIGGRGLSVVEELFRTERPALVRKFARFTSHDGAEDAVQQAFLRVIALKDSRIVAIAEPIAYLHTATRNAMVDQARQRNRERRDGRQFDELTLSGPDPVAAFEARDRLARLGRAVGRLKPFTRDIFLAHRLDGYSYEEIAQRAGLSIRGVEKQMRTAIKLLGRHLRQHD